MSNFFPSITSIGLESVSDHILAAKVSFKNKYPLIIQLSTIATELHDVKQLYINHPFITTGIESHEILIRPIALPLTKEKDIAATLPFQMEPLLPFPLEDALFSYQVVEKKEAETFLTVLIVRKSAVEHHLTFWKSLFIDPEKVSCIPSALCRFAFYYIALEEPLLILHIQRHLITCVLIKQSKLIASFSQREGLNLLLAESSSSASLAKTKEEWKEISQSENDPLFRSLKQLTMNIIKLKYALAKELKAETIQGCVFTGEVLSFQGLREYLVEITQLPLLPCKVVDGFSEQQLLSYALPIGLAIESLPQIAQGADFRQQEWAYSHFWRRLRFPLLIYYILTILLSFLLYLFSHYYLKEEENQLKQAYINALTDTSKTQESFEREFLVKNPSSRLKFGEEIPSISQLDQEDLQERIAFLEKELRASPETFPLLPNTPRVTDVLAWLTQHHAIVYQDEKGETKSRLQIESFSYVMVKRPQQGKKQEKYQVKIELEFSSPKPKWARELHDALIEPNDFVDPKSEVKWNSNRGKYKTSFYLKDKTFYPSSNA